MNAYIALFRGINIGGHNLLPMKGLVAILEEMGCKNIRTYIQSGNVVFQTRKRQSDLVAKEISLKILERLIHQMGKHCTSFSWNRNLNPQTWRGSSLLNPGEKSLNSTNGYFIYSPLMEWVNPNWLPRSSKPLAFR